MRVLSSLKTRPLGAETCIPKECERRDLMIAAPVVVLAVNYARPTETPTQIAA